MAREARALLQPLSAATGDTPEASSGPADHASSHWFDDGRARRGISGRCLQAIQGLEVALGHEALSGSANRAAELGQC